MHTNTFETDAITCAIPIIAGLNYFELVLITDCPLLLLNVRNASVHIFHNIFSLNCLFLLEICNIKKINWVMNATSC